MLRFILFTVLIAGALSEATTKTPEHFVVGGQPTDIQEHPYQLSIQTDGHVCGASIIDSKWAVTAAHCVGLPANKYGVRAGSSNKANGTLYPIKNIIRHPDYKEGSKDYDIALLEINGMIAFNENVKPIKLAESELPDGTVMNVTGWGMLSEGGDSPQELRVASVAIVNRDTCKTRYSEVQLTVTDSMICAGPLAGGQGFCNGDAGGPLTTGDHLYGITSWSFGCARKDYPGVYTSVPKYRQWIKKASGV